MTTRNIEKIENNESHSRYFCMVIRSFENNPKPLTQEKLRIKTIFQEYLENSRIQLIGPIRQEILSGISEISTYKNLREHLIAFDDIEIND